MASMFLWAIGFPAAEFLLVNWPPLSLIAVRMTMAVLFLVPIWAILEGPATLARANWGRGAFVGGLGFGVGAWLLLVAQSLTDPVTVAVIVTAMPVAAVALEVLLDGRRPNRDFLFGLIASVSGGVLAIDGLSSGGSGVLWTGVSFAVASVVLFAWGSRATIRDFPGLTAIGRTTITVSGAALFCSLAFLGGSFFGWAHGPANPVDGVQFGLLAAYALGSLALSHLLWIGAVGRLGVSIASFHTNSAPFYVMLILVFLGQDWSWRKAIGAAIVGLGVIIAQRKPGSLPPAR